MQGGVGGAEGGSRRQGRQGRVRRQRGGQPSLKTRASDCDGGREFRTRGGGRLLRQGRWPCEWRGCGAPPSRGGWKGRGTRGVDELRGWEDVCFSFCPPHAAGQPCGCSSAPPQRLAGAGAATLRRQWLIANGSPHTLAPPWTQTAAPSPTGEERAAMAPLGAQALLVRSACSRPNARSAKARSNGHARRAASP